MRISCPYCGADAGRCPEALPACRARGDETRRLIARANGYPDTPGEAQQRVIEEAVVRALAPVLRERDAAERRCEALRADLDGARDLADIADAVRVSQIDELRAIIAGSPDAPTDAELDAHTGAWLARLYNGAFATMTATAVRNARGVLVRGGPYAVRWWAIDSDERFCPRHVVTVATATLGAGPRDADGREVTP